MPLSKIKPRLVQSFRQLTYAAALIVASATAALAHAHLDHAVPAAGSVVQSAPAQIRIAFSEAVEPAFSVIEVLDRQGNRVDQDKAVTDPADSKVLTVKVKPLTPGTYKVVWRVVSVDAHKSRGDFSFTVAQ